MPKDNPNPEKVYIKNFKINDLLNDLFTSLTTSKPDDPIEFCLKHLESKLAPEKLRPSLSSGAGAKLSDVSGVDGGKPVSEVERNLLSKLLNVPARGDALASGETSNNRSSFMQAGDSQVMAHLSIIVGIIFNFI